MSDQSMRGQDALGWAPGTVGELDHRLLKAPSVKLRGAHVGPRGDTVYCIDLRLRQPNGDDPLSRRRADTGNSSRR